MTNETCEYCSAPAYKTTGQARLICYNRASFGVCPIPNEEHGEPGTTLLPKQKRNTPCRCGSGKKAKHCCK